MPRPPSIVWYYKQYLGDNAVLSMDWDVRGMHVHLLMLSIQETPPGTIPAADAAIRRWLSLPPGSVDDQAWRRIKSQLLAAWQPEGDRLVNRGMVETCERKQRYALRYENGTKTERKSAENHCNSKSKDSLAFSFEETTKSEPAQKPEVIAKPRKRKQKIPPTLEEVAAYCAERGNQVDPAKWFDHYESNGWHVGKNPMSDWHAAVRTWERNSPVSQAALGTQKYDTAGNEVLMELVKQGKAW